ncbi:MAG TPA: hypothetical protein ENH85_05500 [Candidatus Scalindua sp.]|nr:hypothetical protein [Candidatus Scalindua sp.]
MNRRIVGQMILANILEMSIDKYLNYVDRFITITSAAPFYKIYHIDKRIMTMRPRGVTGVVVREADEFRFYSPKYIKLNFELLWEPGNIKLKYSMNWIKTKNLFIYHIMNNLLTLQRNFWQTQDRKRLVPISLKEFLEEYPFLYLDVSRLSRLLNNNWIFLNGAKYLLRDLFWSTRKVHACIMQHVIRQQQHRMKERKIRDILKRDYGINISVRTTCNYRNSVHIPAYNKDYLTNPYDNGFSRIRTLHKKSLPMIPKRTGVYEISINKDIKYQNFASRVIYFGRSINLRNRIQSYLYDNIKNAVIEYYQKSYELFIRYFATYRYIQVEEELLVRFMDKFGSLPVANKCPKRK